MSYIVKSGSPYLRYFDPMAPQVNVRGLQPQSSFVAPLAYRNLADAYTSVLGEDNPMVVTLSTDILLFGCDYPQRVGLSQCWPGVTVSSDGSSLPYDYAQPSLSSYGNPAAVYSVNQIPQVLVADAPTLYQQKITGETVTDGVRVTGFPLLATIDSHDVFVAPVEGPPLDVAPFVAEFSVELSSATTNGPAAWYGSGLLPITVPRLRQPIILWEGDFTQQIVNNGFQISGTVFNDLSGCTLDVVGIWAASYDDAPWEPLGKGGAKVAAFGADPAAADAEAAPVSRWSVNPAIADLKAAFPSRKR